MALNFANLNVQPINLSEIYGRADQDKFNRMKMQEAEKNLADEQALKGAYAFTPDGQLDESVTLKNLYGVAPQKAYEFQQNIDKRNLDATKAKSEAEKEKLLQAKQLIELQGQSAKNVLANPTLDNAIYHTQQFGKLTGQDVSSELVNLQQIGDNPDALRKWAGGHALTAEQMLGKIQSVNNGQFTINQMVDPLTGKAIETGRTQMQATPDAIMSNERAVSEGALNRGVQLRGQNISENNARLSRNQSEEHFNKTLEQNKSKIKDEKITADMRTSGQYAKRMVAAEKLLEATTEQQPGILEKIAGDTPLLGNETSANMARSPDRQKALQAQRDWVRAKLRKESGASIGVDEMANEIYTYFPQIGDSNDVIAQKKQARDQAVNGLIDASGGAYSTPQDMQKGVVFMPKNEKMPKVTKKSQQATASNW